MIFTVKYDVKDPLLFTGGFFVNNVKKRKKTKKAAACENVFVSMFRTSGKPFL